MTGLLLLSKADRPDVIRQVRDQKGIFVLTSKLVGIILLPLNLPPSPP